MMTDLKGRFRQTERAARKAFEDVSRGRGLVELVVEEKR